MASPQTGIIPSAERLAAFEDEVWADRARKT